MAGQPTAVVSVQTVVDGGSVRVSAPGGPIRILDARPPQNWSVEEVEESLERHRQRSGALVAYVRAQVEASWERIRGELNRVAGGQASDRVMTLARYAMCANYAVELQCKRAEVAIGEEAKTADAAVRDFSGLTAVAAARLNEAFALAEAEAKKGSAASQLINSLVSQMTQVSADPASSTSVPVSPPGGSAVGAPLSPNPAPISVSPTSPDPGDSK